MSCDGLAWWPGDTIWFDTIWFGPLSGRINTLIDVVGPNILEYYSEFICTIRHILDPCCPLNTWKLKWNGCHFPDDNFKCIFLKGNCCLLIHISLNIVLRVQLIISLHWFRWWLCAEEATSRYLNQWWSTSPKHICITRLQYVNTLRPRQNGLYFPDDIFKCIFLNENV